MDFDDIPDMQTMSFDDIARWIESRIAAIATTDFTPAVTDSFAPLELREDFDSAFGAEASPRWRRFFLAVLLADWACYDNFADRADFARLKYIMSSAHRYFRLWCCRLPDGQVTPVGYSAWYPIAKFVYDGALADPGQIDDRGAFLPLRFVAPQDARYGYAFNVSVVKPLRNTPCSRRVIKAYQRDAAAYPQVKTIAVTVDEAGSRMSRLVGFDQRGEITVAGETEGLFVRR